FTTSIPAYLGNFVGDYQNQAISIERMLDLVRPAPVEDLIRPRSLEVVLELPVPPRPAAERLQVLSARHLSFQYQSGGTGIADVSLEVRRGEFVVITGRIGAGKSTLLRLMLGLLPSQAGGLYWNGLRVDDPAGFFVPPRCAYASQVPRLFSDTLRENILLGLPHHEDRLSAAIQAAVLEPDVAELAPGLDTVVGPP